MHASHWLSKARTGALIVALSLGLSGCFDLAQKVEIGRDGAGRYKVAITAGGIVGDALKEKPVTIEKHDHAVTTTRETDGKVTQTTVIDFKTLSDLRLSDEVMSLHVLEHSFFGLGPTHVRFRRTFLVGNARKANADRMGEGDDEASTQILAGMFGDHTYTFSVTVPGSILRIAPVRLGGKRIEPQVSGDFYHGHTITWTMPLYRMLSETLLTFEVDFSAYGSFSDVQSAPEAATSL
jgi:hypothetical protein